MRDLLDRRLAGILLHPTSLPGSGAQGRFGADAHRFVQFLAEAGIGVWQVLPLGPTHADGSPYQCLSAHAIDPRFLDVERLNAEGWPLAQETERTPGAFDVLLRGMTPAQRVGFEGFRAAQAHWLDDYALFIALKAVYHQCGWFDWPAPLRERDPEALRWARHALRRRIEGICLEQYLLYSQWLALREHARERGILLFGDMPIFVAYDSADVWSRPELFLLDDLGRPTHVAGVPPDYFSATGQRWGNPLYAWERHAADGYQWWRERLRSHMALFDLVRIDHFRGLEAYWEIPVSCPTAIEGRWVPGPGAALLAALAEEAPGLPLIAEDLGIITPEVVKLREDFHLPGMRILHFAFDGGADNPYLPHRHTRDSVVFTGTHDNDTTVSWFASLSAEQQSHVRDYLGVAPEEDPARFLSRTAFASVANLAIIPLQDALELGGEARMNTPGTTEGNWAWRFDWEELPDDLAARLRHMSALYGRLPQA